MTDHTPGPWGLLSRGADGDGGELFGWDLDGPPEPAMRGTFALYADAKLAAAAPDLAEALLVLRSYFLLPDDEQTPVRRATAQSVARAALRKAGVLDARV